MAFILSHSSFLYGENSLSLQTRTTAASSDENEDRISTVYLGDKTKNLLIKEELLE
jgi:hypothetical protein